MAKFDTQSAQAFCRAYAPKGYLAGAGLWSAEKWLAAANRLAGGLSDVRLAEMLNAIRAKAKFRGHRCSKCGRPISDPESVAAGVGPECQAK